MDFAKQANRGRQAIAEQPQPVFECRDVVGDLHHVVERHAGRMVEFVEQ